MGQYKISARVFTSRKFLREVLAAVLNEETGKLMECHHLIGNLKYQELWQNSYGNEVG